MDFIHYRLSNIASLVELEDLVFEYKRVGAGIADVERSAAKFSGDLHLEYVAGNNLGYQADPLGVRQFYEERANPRVSVLVQWARKPPRIKAGTPRVIKQINDRTFVGGSIDSNVSRCYHVPGLAEIVAVARCEYNFAFAAAESHLKSIKPRQIAMIITPPRRNFAQIKVFHQKKLLSVYSIFFDLRTLKINKHVNEISN